MANQTGIEISIKAWLPTGKGLDEQFQALSLVKAAHESGDYAPLLKAATIEGVKTESKTRRMEAVQAPAGNGVEDQPGDEHGREPLPAGDTEASVYANPTPGDQSSEPTGNTASSSDRPVDGSLGLDEPAPHDSNVGDAPVDRPELEGELLPNPTRKARKAA